MPAISKTFSGKIQGIWVNPNLPENFDCTANERRPKSHMKWWDIPYISICENECWPDGMRYDIRCLNGGAWDRSTCLGQFGSLQESLDFAKAY